MNWLFLRYKLFHIFFLCIGWVVGSGGEKMNLSCKPGKTIHIKKVRTSAESGCCSHASKSVLNAMCGGKDRCEVKVARETLGAHCTGKLSKLQIRYKCVVQVKKNLCSNDWCEHPSPKDLTDMAVEYWWRQSRISGSDALFESSVIVLRTQFENFCWREPDRIHHF